MKLCKQRTISKEQALAVYQEHAIVNYPGPQRQSSAAFAVFKGYLTYAEICALGSARSSCRDKLHRASEFNDACQAIRDRWAAEAKL